MGTKKDASPTNRPANEAVKRAVPEDSEEIVYTELNLEKWSIWEPSSSKRSPRARIIERQRILGDGSHVIAKVEIGFTQHGNLSTRDQKIYYVLFKLWDDAGRPATPVPFSLQKIARLLGEEWSSHAHRTITRSLLQLRNIWFNWENSYFDKSSGEHLEVLDTFNILSELTLARRTKKLHATTEMCVFQFHRQLLENLYANHTTPLFLATVLSFKSEIAQMLYPRLDLLLADKKHYERRTKELFEELGLESETYRHRSARKRVIERALEELQGAPLTTGCILAATVEPTKDDTDFKIVIVKGARRARLAPPSPAPPAAAAPASPPHLPQAKRADGATGSATSRATTLAPSGASVPEAKPEAVLVRYFHQQFHGASPQGTLNPKEMVGAARLIQRHGLQKARALVDFAGQEAPKTKYAPASLNGILQYEERFEVEEQEQERALSTRRERQEQHQRAQAGQAAHQREIVAGLMAEVGEVKTGAPRAFSAFLRQIEMERAAFLATPIARHASASTRELLSRAYEQPEKRLEIFLSFFAEGSDGEALLSVSPAGQRVARWLGTHGKAARQALEGAEFGEGIAELLA